MCVLPRDSRFSIAGATESVAISEMKNAPGIEPEAFKVRGAVLAKDRMGAWNTQRHTFYMPAGSSRLLQQSARCE